MLIQRISSPFSTDSTHLQYLLETRKKYPGCFDEVWFSSHYGYPQATEHHKLAQQLYSSAKRLVTDNICRN